MNEDKSSSRALWLNGPFSQRNCGALRDQIIDAALEDDKAPILIHINSYGGEVDSLNLLLDTLDSVPNKIITSCAGTAMSAGAILLSHGDERYISSNSRIMIHKISSWSQGNTDDILNDAKETVRMNKQMLGILAQNTGKSVKELETLLSRTRDLFLDARAAVRFGIVDKIGLPYLETITDYKLHVKKS
jgi:ATP-dependent Clp protease protease subunit